MWMMTAPTWYGAIAGFILGLTVLLIYAMVHILVRKYHTSAQEQRTAKKRHRYREIIASVARGDEAPGLNALTGEERLDLRNLIADISSELKGHSFDRVQELYFTLGFEIEDVMQLQKRDLNKKMRALHRLEKLKAEIPHELHVQLMHDESPVIRLLSVLLYIHNYKRAATPKVIAFIEQKRYGRKGYLFYIIQEIGRHDRDALSFLFERINDPEFEEALLISASISPPRSFDEIIYRKLNKKSAPFVVVWALRALVHYPTPKLFSLIDVLKDHPFWAIRLEVVRILNLFDPALVAPYVDGFMRDQNYLVRSEATLYAIKHSDFNLATIKAAIHDEGHPARSVALYQLTMHGLHDEAA